MIPGVDQKFWKTLTVFLGIFFVSIAINWFLKRFGNDGLIYWLRYFSFITAIIIGFYICVLLFALFNQIWHNWQYPEYDRELTQSEISFIESQMKELSDYLESRNFGSKRYWTAAWALIGLFGIAGFGLFKPLVIVLDGSPTISGHPEYGHPIYVDENVWTSIPSVITGISAFFLLAFFFACLATYIFKPFAEAITVSLTMEETSLGEKADTIPKVIEKYLRYNIIDTHNYMSGDRILAFIGWRRRMGLLKWGLGLAVLTIPLYFLSLQNGTRYYERGLSIHSLLTLSSKDLAYKKLDFVGVACLYNDEEKETAQQFWYFSKDNKTMGRMRFPVNYDQDFDTLNNYLILLQTNFQKLNYTFERKSKNVENPFEHCASKLMAQNPDDHEWIRKVLHLDEFEGSAE